MTISDTATAIPAARKKSTTSSVEFLLPLSGLQLPYWVQFARDPKAGQVQVQFWLSGIESNTLLQNAWSATQQQFQSLRATVNIAPTQQPVMVIRKTVKSSSTIVDWSAVTEKDQEQLIAKYLASDRDNILSIDKAPNSRVFFARLGKDKVYCLWTCHHLLFDGWSAAVIINRLLLNYQSYSQNNAPTPMQAPDYVEYRQVADNQSKQPSEEFWRQTLRGFNQPTVFCNHPAEPAVIRSTHLLSLTETEKLTQFCKSQAVTLGTIAQIAWALTCAQHLNRNDIAFGMVTHGRSQDFAGIDYIAGQLSNVIPVRANINSEQTFSQWLKLFQTQQFDAGNHAHMSLNEVLSLSEPATRTLAFDSVLAIETMPAIQPEEFSLPAVTHYDSNLISAFPVNVTVVPAEQIRITIEIRNDTFGEKLAASLNDKLYEILSQFPAISKQSPAAFLSHTNPVPTNVVKQSGFRLRNTRLKNIISARTEFDLQVLSIWEDVLQKYPLSMDSDFFDNGGNSLGALRLLADIKDNFDIEMSLAYFIENPTVQSMCDYLNADRESIPIKSLVLLRPGTKEQNLFCLHAGGGHALFYRPLALRINNSFSIYALQPKELGGDSVPSDSVSDMVDKYINEIFAVQPHGPYHLLCYCFGAALTLEIIKKLLERGEEVGNVIIADAMAPIPSSHPMSMVGWRAYILYEFIVQRQYKSIFHATQHQLRRWLESIDTLTRRNTLFKELHSGNNTLTLNGTSTKTSENQIVAESDLRGHSSRVQIACERAFHKYRANSCQTHMHFLHSDSSTRRDSFDVFMRHWQTLAPNRTEHRLNANHAQVMIEPFVAKTAEIVNTILEDK